MKKMLVVGVLGAILVLLVQGVFAYVHHDQAIWEEDEFDLDDAGGLCSFGIVRNGLDELDEDIVIGHGCTLTSKYGPGVYCPECYSAFESHTAINFYSSLDVVDKGYVLKDGDDFCEGDDVEVVHESARGEWFTKGGPSDTPPIQWVSCGELRDMLTHLVEWHKTNIYPDDYKPVSGDSAPDSYVVHNDAVNRKDIVVYQTIISDIDMDWYGYFAVLCCQGETSPLSEAENSDASVYEVNSDPKCIMYFDSLYSAKGQWHDKMAVPSIKYNYLPTFKPLIFKECSGEYYAGTYLKNTNWIDEYFESSLFAFNHSTTVNQMTSATAWRGPDVKVTGSYYDSSVYDGDPLYMRITVKNAGDMKAHIDRVSLNLDEYEIIYAPKSLDAGKVSEIVIETAAQDVSSLELMLEFFSDKLGCLSTKDFSKSFSLGSVDVTDRPFCKESGDCVDTGMDSPVCCRSLCYDLSRGTCDDLDGDGTFEWSYY